jgi:hypothetical protein
MKGSITMHTHDATPAIEVVGEALTTTVYPLFFVRS